MPRPDGTESVLWDSELCGFGIRVQRGGVRSYVLQYRAGDQRGAPLRKFTIGRHGSPWTPETARREARRLLGAIANGTDPAAARAERREAPTIADLAQRFLSEHAEAKRKPSTAAEYRRLIDKVILPALGTRRVADVTRAEIANSTTSFATCRIRQTVSSLFSRRCSIWLNAGDCDQTDPILAAMSKNSVNASVSGCSRRQSCRGWGRRSRGTTVRLSLRAPSSC